MAAIFTLTLAVNTMVTSVEGLRYVKKSAPRPLRQWRKFKKNFQVVDTKPIIVAFPAYLAEEGGIHGVYAEWDDSRDHVVLDSGTTHTILFEEKFFVGDIRPTTAQIIGATGPGPADGEGTAKFSITDDNGTKFNVIQHDALLSKKLGKNLVSINALNLQYGNEYFRLSTVENISLLTWGHEKYKKHFMHHPLCPISEMAVNEGDHAGFCAFAEKYVPKKIYSFLAPAIMTSVFNPGVDLPDDEATISTTDHGESKKKVDNVNKPGSVKKTDIHKALEDPEFCMECESDKERQVYYRWMPDATQQKIVMLHSKNVNESGMLVARVRVLNTDNFISLPMTSLTPIDMAEPTTIPVTKNDIDQAIDSLDPANLTKEDVQKLWNPGTALSVKEQILLHLHEKYQHCTLETLKNLSLRGELPLWVSKVKKMPLCPACLFGRMHKKPWRGNPKKDGTPSTIRRPCETEPGHGISADHLVCAQGGAYSPGHRNFN